MNAMNAMNAQKQDLRDAQIASYTALAREGAPILYLVSDSVSTSKVKPFRDAFPEKVVNVGIAEQNLIGFACGLASGGFIPVTGNAAPFLISRSLEQIKVDLSYSRANVKINGMHSGFSYGTDGVTHHEVNDVCFMRGMPALEIYVPCDARECTLMTRYGVLERKGPVYTSLNTGAFPVITPEDYKFMPGKPVQFAEGSDLTLIALGSAVHDVLAALPLLNCSCDVFAVTSIRPFDGSALAASAKKTGHVLAVEQHSTNGGVGSLAAALIAGNGIGARLAMLGIPEGSFTKNWTAPENKKHFGLDAEGIARTARELLWNTPSR